RAHATDEDLVRRLKQLPPATDRLAEPAVLRTERAPTFLVQSCRAGGARPVLVTLPHFTRAEGADVGSLSAVEATRMERFLAHWDLSPRGWRDYASRVNRLIAAVAQSQQVPLVAGDSLNDPRHFADAVHLNARGNQLLGELVGPSILPRDT